MEIDLKQKASEWQELLKSCEFIGEISLSQKELKNLSSSFWKSHTDLSKEELYAILPVIAVNCAYYYYDDEGFWTHFCKILNVPNVGSFQQYLGNKIEQSLLAQSFIKKAGESAWRYVGPILEQCGITRRYIEKFGTIINDGAVRYGWEGLWTIDYRSYKALIEIHTVSTYLKKFLFDHSGYTFFKAVARNIAQYQRRDLELVDLQHITGYRPGFWNDLIRTLSAEKIHPQQKSRKSIPMPKLFFDPDYLCIFIQFDRDYVNKGYYKLNEDQVNDPKKILTDIYDFSDRYYLEIKNEDGTWNPVEVKGWTPNISPFAFFEQNKGYISEVSRISPGTYYLLLPIDLSEDIPEGIIISNLGIVSLPFDEFYKAFQVSISNIADLNFLKIELSMDNNNFLSWDNPKNRFVEARDVSEVFCGELPAIKIKQANLFRSNQIALFVDFGEGRNRIPIKDEKEEVILPFNVKKPSKGMFWVEPISRSSRFSDKDIIDCLSFCVIPYCSINWPSHLLSSEETIEISFSGDDNVEIELEKCIPLDTKKRVWRIPPEVKIVEGILRSDTIPLTLVHHLHRASIFSSPRIEKSKFSERFSSIAEGLPDMDFQIVMLAEKKYNLGNLGKFDKFGRKEFSSFDIRDSIMNITEPTGRFMLVDGDRLVPTNTYFYDPQRIKEKLLTNTEDSLLHWIAFSDEEMQKSLLDLSRIIAGTIQTIDIGILDDITNGLREWVVELIACSFVFDKIEGNCNCSDIQLQLTEEIKTGLDWYLRAQAVYDTKNLDAAENKSEDLLEEIKAIEWRPCIIRWKDQFEKIRDRLQSEHELTPLIEEWAKEVKDSPHQYASKLSFLPFGTDLTLSWHFYYMGDYPKAYKKAKKIIDHAKGLTYDLAVIVAQLCLLKTGRFEQMDKIIIHNCHRKLNGHMSTLVWAAKILTNPKAHTAMTSLINSLDCSLLPLRNEDMPLLKREFLNSNPTVKNKLGCEYWLFLLVAMCYAKHRKDNDTVLSISRLLNTCYNIPNLVSVSAIFEKLMRSNHD